MSRIAKDLPPILNEEIRKLPNGVPQQPAEGRAIPYLLVRCTGYRCFVSLFMVHSLLHIAYYMSVARGILLTF